MSKKEIPEILTIPGLRNGYETGSFSPRDVVEAAIERSAALAEKHIFITPPSMELIGPHLAELPPMDFKKYPLWGIPFAIKDNIDLAGAETTAACPAYAYQPEESATVVKKLLAAGAIPIGKTTSTSSRRASSARAALTEKLRTPMCQSASAAVRVRVRRSASPAASQHLHSVRIRQVPAACRRCSTRLSVGSPRSAPGRRRASCPRAQASTA